MPAKKTKHCRNPRKLSVERLDSRRLLAGDLHNTDSNADVNDDLQVSSFDALLIINAIANHGSGIDAASLETDLYLDVDGDGTVNPFDALLVVNYLARWPLPESQLRLISDTAPGGTTNTDRVTSNVAIRGRIADYDSSGGTQYALRGHSDLGNERSLDLSPYSERGYFHVPNHNVTAIVRQSSNTVYRQATVELVSHSSDAWAADAVVLTQIDITLDTSGPIIILPEAINPESDTFGLTIFEPGQMTAASLPSLTIRQAIGSSVIGNEGVSKQLDKTTERVFIELARDQFQLDDSEDLELQFDGLLEDIAGNQTTLSVRREIPQDRDFTPPPASSSFEVVVPDLGQAFDQTRPAARPGQEISFYVPSALHLGNYYFETVKRDRQDPEGNLVVEQEFHTSSYDQATGTVHARVPSNAVTGPIRNDRGDVVAELQVVPSSQRLPSVSNGRWHFGNFVAFLGGIDVATETLFYREFDSDGLTDPAIDQFVSQVETLGWKPIRDDGLVTSGFATAQIAGESGVSGPVLAKTAFPNVTGIELIAIDSETDTFWIFDGSALNQIDYLSGASNSLFDVDQYFLESNGEEIVDFRPFESVAFGHRIVPNHEGDGIPAKVLALAVSRPEAGREWVLLNPEDGREVGRVSESIDYSDADNNAVSIHNEINHSLVQVWKDGSRWQEVSLRTGTVIRAGYFSEEARSAMTFVELAGQQVMLGGLFWDGQKVQLIMPPNETADQSTAQVEVEYGCGDFDTNVASGQRSTVLELNGETGGFTFSTHSFLTDDRTNLTLRPLIQRGDWLIDTRPPINSGNQLASSIIRRCLVEVDRTPLPDGPSVIDRLEAVAVSGQPADMTIASANPGQWVEVVGQNLTNDTKLVFQIDQREILNSQLGIATIGVEAVSLSDVSEDRTRARVLVPIHATTGMVSIERQNEGPLLQVVPKIARFTETITGSNYSERNAHSYDYLGLPSNNFEIRIDGMAAIKCQGNQVDACDVNLFHLPGIRQSVEVITPGGTDTRYFPSDSLAQPQWKIESIQGYAPNFASEYSYDGLQPNQVLAGSDLFIRLTPVNEFSSTPMPSFFEFALHRNVLDNGQRASQTTFARLQDDGSYKLTLPFDFPGGSLEIISQVRMLTLESEAFRVNVAPTVIAASGDSSARGSSVLLAGVDLKKATFTIDGIEVDWQETPPQEDFDLDTVILMVPDEATAGVLQMSLGEITATLSRLEPWWQESGMPVADEGIAAFPSLPSANDGQRVQSLVDYPRSDGPVMNAGDGQLLHTEYGRESVGHGKIERLSLSTVAILNPSTLLAESSIKAWGSLYFFGTDQAGRSLNLVQMVPKIDDAIVVHGTSPRDRFFIETRLRFESRNLSSESGIQLQWGDRSWDASVGNLYKLQLAGDLYLNSAIRFGPTIDSAIFSMSEYGAPSTQNEPAIWFGTENLQDLPNGPISVSNGWGASTLTLSDPTDLEIDWVAESGTPADPWLPSVNVRQQLEVPDGFAERQDGIFFTRNSDPESDYSGDRANWTSATADSLNFNKSYFENYRVPPSATSGIARFGFLGESQFVQVVPTIDIWFSPNEPTYNELQISLNGIDIGAYLLFGNHPVALSDDEISTGFFKYRFDDPRLTGVTAEDLAGGISVVASGGQSRVASIPVIHQILVNGEAAEQNAGPIVLRPGDELTFLGQGLASDGLNRLASLEKPLSSSSLLSITTLSDDGKQATLRTNDPDFTFGDYGIYRLTYEGSWALAESRFQIEPKIG